MIPVLFPASATSWESFGLGALTDAISCTVTEERNGAYELEMEYPISGAHYSEISLREFILARPNFTDTPQPFRIYQITKPINGIVTIYAQHLSYDLSGYVVSPFEAIGAQATMAAITSDSYVTPTDCPFVFTTDISDTKLVKTTAPMSVRAFMGGSEESILKSWYGEWSFDKYHCTFSAHRGADRGVTIRYGKNLISIEQEENIAAVYTGVFPYYQNSDSNILVMLPEKVINVPGTFDFTRIYPLNLTSEFEEAPSEEQLRTAANAYINDHDIGVPDVNLELSFVQLDEIRERVDLCDTVHVYFDALGISVSAKCIRTEWDVLADRYNQIELGALQTSLASTIAEIRDTAQKVKDVSSTFTETAQQISEKITGNMGGYVVLHDTNADGAPDEILVMDTDDIDTAVNVIRINNGGIAFSQDGYHGTYRTAWNIDSEFVADFITAGTLQADLVKILGTTNFYWDAGNIYIIKPDDDTHQIRIGKYDGINYGIGFTRDGGVTWQSAMDFNGLNVTATNFARTYIQTTPPDPEEYDINIGDIWIESDRRYQWKEVGEHDWAWAAQHTWNDFGGDTDPNMYTWNGGSWQKIYDGESFDSFETRLTIAENEIDAAVRSVAQKGVTYIQPEDPRNNPGVTVNIGDHWIKGSPGKNALTWDDAEEYTWDELGNFSWSEMLGIREYAWDGYSWILVSDRGAEIMHSIQIAETDKQLQVLAVEQTKINGEVVRNTAKINVTATALETEVAQRKNDTVTMSSRITQTAEQISSEVTRATEAEGQLGTRITQTAEDLVGLITAGDATTMVRAYQGGVEVGKIGNLYRALINADGSFDVVCVFDASKTLSETPYMTVASFGTSAIIGNTVNEAHVEMSSDALDLYDRSHNSFAHLGIGMGSGTSGQIKAPYFTLGQRANSSIGAYSLVEGSGGTASAWASHAEGYNTSATGQNSHAEGHGSVAAGFNSHAEGESTRTSGNSAASHAEGMQSNASGIASHAEGSSSTASGDSSHAEGNTTKATNSAAHAEGMETSATGHAAHAEGISTTASGAASHAEGNNTEASAQDAHAEGVGTVVSAMGAHAEGFYTIAASRFQHVFGQYNVSDWNNTYIEIVGNGSIATTTRSNARTLDSNGNEWIAGTLTQGSDKRLKDILPEQVPDVSGIKARVFRWNGIGNRDERKHIGYIAQDVEQICPELVQVDAQGYKSLDYIAFLCAKIESLETRIAELEGN